MNQIKLSDMRYLLKISSICIFSFYSCNQVNNSIKETLNPDSNAVRNTGKTVTKNPDINKTSDSQGTIENSVTQTDKEQQKIHKTEQNKNFFANSLGLEKAEKELRQLPQYLGKEIFIYQSIQFYDDGSISVTLRHPTNFKYVDQYHYRDGKWSEPTPVQLSAKYNINDRMLPLDSIRFISAFNVAKAYNEKVPQVEGAKPITNVYATIWGNLIRWFPITINGTRERYSINFNTDGTLKNFSQD